MTDTEAQAAPLVLIVEDNPASLKLFRFLLNRGGYRTLEATTAERGFALALEHRPWLILMDVELPGLDGIGALQRLRANPTTAPIPTVALTAFAMKHDRARLLAAGFDGYMAKPIDAKSFCSRLATYLAQGRLAP